MNRLIRAACAAPLLAATLLATPLLTAGPVAAQSAAPATGPTSTTAPVGVVAASGNPNLAVASVRMENGIRASKIIGSGVYSDPNTQIGTVDDLMLTPDNKVALAIVSVGGLIGIGGKLTAVPITQLQRAPDGKLILPGASKESLNAEPNFVY